MNWCECGRGVAMEVSLVATGTEVTHVVRECGISALKCNV